MIDAHTHVLPNMDDGSDSVSMSGKMLRMLKEQGVDVAFATSHYYSDRETPEAFLRRRDQSMAKLRA